MPQQARAILHRAVDALVPFSWFNAGEAYGQSGLRDWCEERDTHYVMATRKTMKCRPGCTTTRVDELIARIRPGAWRRISCGDGAHGRRV